MSGIVTQARAFRAALLTRERAEQESMIRQWLAVEKRLRDQMLVLAYQLQGGEVRTLHQIASLERYQRLLQQVRAELELYGTWLVEQVRKEQTDWAWQGVSDAQGLVRNAAGPGVMFGRLPVEAVENLVGWSADGTTLGTLLQDAFVDLGMPRGWQQLQQALVQGIALGWHPEKTAKAMASALSGGLQRAMTIARTEQIRAYRSASLLAYQESGSIRGHKRLTAHDGRACAACLADEGHVYAVDEMIWSHPQCRCTSVPVMKDGKEPEWELGEEWLRKQSESTQNKVFGNLTAADAFRRGVPLREFMKVTHEGDWGITIRVQNPIQLMAYPGKVQQPALFPTAQANVLLSPMGEAVSGHIRLPKRSKYHDRYRNALDLVDSVHGDGPLPEVVLSTKNLGEGTYGGFGPFPAQWEILVNAQYAPHVETTMIHEIGHWIDYGGLGQNGVPGTTAAINGKLANWRDAIVQSPEVDALLHYQGGYGVTNYIRNYLLSPTELWARSYAQYIGEKTQNNEILATMDLYRQRPDFEQYRQWQVTNFAPIYQAIDGLLIDLGWMVK